MPSISRRRVLRAVAAGSVVGLAGCSSSCPDTDDPEPEQSLDDTDDSAGPLKTVPTTEWARPRFDAANTGFVATANPPTDPEALRLHWRVNLPAAGAQDRSGLISAPIVVDGMVVVVTTDGVHALDVRDGSQQWHRPDITLTELDHYGVNDPVAPPVSDGDTVYVGGRDALTALDIADGSIRWQHTETSGVGPATISDGVVVAVTETGIVALDASNGTDLWEEPDDVETSLLAAADGSLVAAGVRTGDTRRATVAFDIETGERQWSTSEHTTDSYPVVADGSVYLGDYQGLHAVSLADGEHRFTFDRGGGRSFSPPVVTDDTLYAVEQPGEAGDATFALDRTGGKPEPRWCSEAGDGLVTAATTDHAFALSSTGTGPTTSTALVAFGDRFGDSPWGYTPRAQVLPPAVLDGVVIAVDRTGTVAVLGEV